MRSTAAWLALSLLCLSAPAFAGEEPPKFDDLVRGATAREGLLDTYEKGDHLYLALPADRLGREMLLVPRLDQGVGAVWLFGGLMFDRQAASLVAFERHGDRVFLVKRAHRFTASPGSAEEAALALSIGDSVLQSAPVVTTRPDGAVVIDVYEWFVSDLSNIDRWLRQGLGKSPDQPGQASLDRSRSYLAGVKAFPKNVEISAKLTFTPGEPPKLESLPDRRFLPLTLHYSFAQLPDTPMEPRLADDRLGYLITVRKDFSRTEDEFYVRYANHWRLEPGEKAGDLYRPKKPIVYYIDRTVPERFRPWVKAGVEEWNRAFEAAGFKDAIRAEPLPEDADPADLRYASIRWITSDQPQFGAVGPSIVDPRTGEILDADILIEATLALEYREIWRFMANPSARLHRLLNPSAAPFPGAETADFADTLAAQAMLLRLDLAADGRIAPGEPAPDEFIGQGIKWVTMHEVGHTLGLDHNFRASAATPFEKIHDREWTRQHGLASSVMDYTPINIAPPGKEDGHFFDSRVGPYDIWAISYGYTPDPERARQLARLGGQPGHDYMMEEHLDTPGALDPTLARGDLSRDPLAWSQERAEIYDHLLSRLPDLALRDNESYAEMTPAFDVLVGSMVDVLVPALRTIGGQYQNNDHVGDPGGRPPFAPVPRREQEKALAWVLERGLGEKAFAVPPGILRQLGSPSWAHWGVEPTFDGRVDYPYTDRVAELQRVLLQILTQPQRLASMRDAELKYGAKEVLTLPELLTPVTEAVWTEAWAAPGRDVPTLRRSLQRAWLDRMTELVVKPPQGTPGDARAIARQELRRVHERIAKRLTPPYRFDAYTEAHLLDVKERIGKTLAAEYQEVP
ncbi:MAG TPA: zinc-dependent metalloprotease [Thermoanaerobaculia bacterium]